MVVKRKANTGKVFLRSTFLGILMDGEVYPEPCKTSNVKLFARIVNGPKLLTINVKSQILDV